MNIEKIIADYDSMYGKYSMDEIEKYLYDNLLEAKLSGENDAQLTLLNEIIGFCRDTAQKEKALGYCDDLKNLLDVMNLEGTVAYATSLLNIANAYRAFDKIQESLKLHQQVLKIYDKHLSTNDFMYASLYNNWSLVYQELGEYEMAAGMLQKALDVLDYHDNAMIPEATTRVNLASVIIQTGNTDSVEKAVEQLEIALEIFEKDGGKDYHYSAALVAMGDVCVYKGDIILAKDYYLKGLEQVEKYTGKNDTYYRILEKLEKTKDLFVGNLEKSRQFYEKHGKKMIRELFPEYEDRIAVGMVGEGSDCFGFDDEISMDHDYSVGFSMWLTEEDYAKIGHKLQSAYNELIKEVYQHKDIDRFIEGRRGATSVNSFYSNILKVQSDYEKLQVPDFYRLDEKWIATATNGVIFRDALGVFSGVRNKLMEYYPEDLWRKKLAQEMHEFSQYAQSNYPRMMARGDQMTASMCVAKAIENALNMVYLLNREYAPYYKWKKKGALKFEFGREIVPVLDKIAEIPNQMYFWKNYKYSPAKINMKDKNVELFEEVAGIILKELQKQKLVKGNDLFLEGHISEILK